MQIISEELWQKLLENGRHRQAACGEAAAKIDFMPVVKLFTPDRDAVWLLTDIDPNRLNLAIGLCDLGLGFPEIGSVSLTEIADLSAEIDPAFEADRPLSAYAREARQLGRIEV